MGEDGMTLFYVKDADVDTARSVLADYDVIFVIPPGQNESEDEDG